MEEEDVFTRCEWCGETFDLEQNQRFHVRMDKEWFRFCSRECRARWSWKEGLPMP